MNLINLGDEVSKYERVYIPKFLRVSKKKLEHYMFIKTISAGASDAHIIMGADEYFMCISSDDKISLEERTMEPMGFRRKTISELETIANEFDSAYKNDRSFSYKCSSRKWNTVVDTPDVDWTLPWHVRMRGHFIINVVTQEEIHLALSKPEIAKQSNLTYHLINVIVTSGIEALNWVYKGKRLDGDTWEAYFLKRAQRHHYKSKDYFSNVVFTNGLKVVHYSSLRRTADEIGTSHETLRKILLAGGKEIGAFNIVYCDYLKGFKVSYS